MIAAMPSHFMRLPRSAQRVGQKRVMGVALTFPRLGAFGGCPLEGGSIVFPRYRLISHGSCLLDREFLLSTKKRWTRPRCGGKFRSGPTLRRLLLPQNKLAACWTF